MYIANTYATKHILTKPNFIRIWSNHNSHTLLIGMQNGTNTLEKVCQFLIRLTIYQLYDQEILFFIIYPRYENTRDCSRKFLTVLFIMAKNWKQPRCPSVGGC